MPSPPCGTVRPHLYFLVYALDATSLSAKRGAKPAPPSNNVVVDTLGLDAPHDHSLIERVAGARAFGKP